MITNIHPTAHISPSATIADGAEIGPNVIVGDHSSIGAGTRVMANAVIGPWTQIGENNVIHFGAIVGHDPQDFGYKGEESWTIVGNGNVIREYVTIHRGNRPGTKTMIGSNNLFMAHSHVAHNCELGSNIILVNGALLAGHVVVEDRVIISGNSVVHQFCRIGTFSYIGGVSGISLDVPPYVIIAGTRNRTRISGVNKVGLKRNGFSRETIKKLDTAFRIIFRTPSLLMKDAIEVAKNEFPECEEVQTLVRFFEDSKRGVVKQTEEE
ncbi:MAG TPA: acyl-ACP--UDP-N-acetylglucosamine O-acyltransferase [Desulfobulbaceae bacterium]|nr:acyl-ACP--UDP-N-acetylglucosamine O-acyltransferase [Desulfobulbaceae bacterium]